MAMVGSAQRETANSRTTDPDAIALEQLVAQARARLDRSTDRGPAQVQALQSAERLVTRIPGDRQFAEAIERIIRRIRSEVRDPKLLPPPCKRIAIAIVCGQDGQYLPPAELEAGLLSLHEKRRELQSAGKTFSIGAGAYFVRSMQNAFARHGLAWPRTKSSPVSETVANQPNYERNS